MLDPDDVDECTKSALSDLVNQLLQPGGLIPLSPSKRVSARATGEAIELSAEVASLWAPLLGYLRDTYGAVFGEILAEELVEAVLREPSSGDEEKDNEDQSQEDANDPSSQFWKVSAFASPSYRKTAEAWLRYLVTSIPPSSHNTSNIPTTRPPTPLITEVELAELCLPYRSASSTADLLEFLCERNEDLKQGVGPLLAVLKVPSFVAQAELESASAAAAEGADMEASGFESYLDVMQERLRQMEEAFTQQQDSQDEVEAQMGTQMEVDSGYAVKEKEPEERAQQQQSKKMPKGWTALSAKDWKPTPFGCLNGKVPTNLVLDL